ncbi:MAG: hypothetical protein H0X70_09665 [Segetibacter sp.]|nr:hypothetical protein [Segetibacter sp.]
MRTVFISCISAPGLNNRSYKAGSILKGNLPVGKRRHPIAGILLNHCQRGGVTSFIISSVASTPVYPEQDDLPLSI